MYKKTPRATSYRQLRVREEDAILLERRVKAQSSSMSKVVHSILHDSQKLGKKNMAYLDAEAKRTGKTIWQVLDNIVFEHQGQQMFKRINTHYDQLSEKAKAEHDEESSAFENFVLEQWADH